MRQKTKKYLTDKIWALKIPYGIPTVGQLPNQLSKATYQRPRTKSATEGHAPNQLPQATYQISYPKGEATYPIRFGFRSSHCRCAPSEPPFERIRASGPPHSRYRVITANAASHQDQFWLRPGWAPERDPGNNSR
jgi:hypothetical protein